jgi:hypothetical protein
MVGGDDVGAGRCQAGNRGLRALAQRLRETLMLPIYVGALLLVLLAVLGILLWPGWSVDARKRRFGIMGRACPATTGLSRLRGQ